MTDKDETLMEFLDGKGCISYGAVFDKEMVQEFLGIDLPEFATKAVFDEAALCELKAIGQVRELLLGQGMYLKGDGKAYRILLPSENVHQVEIMLSSARKKTRRAEKLLVNSPLRASTKERDSQAARILMIKDSEAKTRRNVNGIK